MRVLLDTNLLLRMDDELHPQHADSVAAVSRFPALGLEGVLVPQVLYEFWTVATRPTAVNGLGLDPAQVRVLIDDWTALFPLLRDERGVFPRWYDLVTTGDVKGKQAHDARLVAAMQRHGVTGLLTWNQPDFIRYPGIGVYTPADLLGGHTPT